MTITINLADNLLAELQQKAQRQHVSIEELAVKILEASVEESELKSPEDIVARITANLTPIRPAAGNLADLLQSAPEDPDFNLEEWQRNWTAVEGEMRSITRANDIAEGRR